MRLLVLFPIVVALYCVFPIRRKQVLSDRALFVVGSRRARLRVEMEELKNEKMAQDGGDVRL